MLKALIVAADSVEPNIILKNKELFPTFNRLIEQGVSSAYSAYVQKGYYGSYSSEQNWASIYTGFEPGEHQINTSNVRGEIRQPVMNDFDELQPFWEVLNEYGLSVGLWAAVACDSPVPINGYTVAVGYETINTPIHNREAPRHIQFCTKDISVAYCLNGEPPPRLYPKTLAQQGYSFEELKRNPSLAEEAVSKYCFQDALPNFKAELDYWSTAIMRTQAEHPVDVLYLFTPTTDLIAHCSMCCDNNPVLLSAYQMLDETMGELIDALKPEISIFLSDHGQQNFKDLIPCSDKAVQKEAFAARDDVLWLQNGYIAFEAHNGALLFTAHALKGTFIAAGKGIRPASISGMRTVDIYPTLLEMFDIQIPECRFGFVMDVFDKEVINEEKLYKPNAIKRKSIGLLQTHSVSITDIVINELYIANRFADITVIGIAKYEEIFLGNPRVAGFVPFDIFKMSDYDEVYCGYYDDVNKQMYHTRIF